MVDDLMWKIKKLYKTETIYHTNRFIVKFHSMYSDIIYYVQYIFSSKIYVDMVTNVK